MDRSDEALGVSDISDHAMPRPSTGASRRDGAKQSGLNAALRRARIEQADRADVVADLRGAELTRLDILREHLQPVFDELPAGCDTFDPGLAPGDRPRLFIDMVAFIEMGRDRRSYRFVQDSRAGRTVLSESERIEPTVRSVTDYIARRLIEREKALQTYPAPSRSAEDAGRSSAPSPKSVASTTNPPRARVPAARIFARGFLFVVEIVGSAVLFATLATAAIWAWQRFVH